MRRLSDQVRSESGMTLVELMVTMVIATLVMGVGLTLITSSEQASSRVRDRVDAVQRGRTAMEQITQRIRAMTCIPPVSATAEPVRPVVSATSDQFTFYADLDNDTAYDPEQWRLSAVRDGSGKLTGIREERWPGKTPPVSGAATHTRGIVSGIAAVPGSNGTLVPLFRYHAYPSLNATETVDVGASGTVAAAEVGRVVRVDISYVAKPTATGASAAQNTTLETSVYARSILRGTSVPTFDCTG